MPRKKRSSWGCVQRVGRDVWRIRYQTAEGRRSATVHGTRREADAELARLRIEHEGERRSGPNPTFAECWERWYLPELERRLAEGSLRERTIEIYETEWRLRLGRRWGGTRISGINPAAYQEWLLTLGANQARMSNILAGNLASCAILHGCGGITFKSIVYRMPRKAKAAKAKTVYTLAEIEGIVRALRGTALEVPVMLQGLASCRVGESCAPSLSCVRSVSARGMNIAVVSIENQLAPRGWEIAPVKNPESERPVVLPEPWSLRLLEIAEEGRSRGYDYLNDDGCGRPCSRAMISDAWRSAFKAGGPLHGVPYLRMQKLRNSWETFMRWELGVDKDKIDKMMGHTSPDVRSIYYDRPDEIMFAETVAEAYERRVRRAVGTI